MAVDLKGANERLGPVAQLAAKHGLTVTSGHRPGSITSSGNTSLHASGSAIDVAGPPAKMAAFFADARARWGKTLDELIYTPGGAAQIKNGQPHTYTGAVATDHIDHVHVGFTGKLNKDGGGVLGFLGGVISTITPGGQAYTAGKNILGGENVAGALAGSTIAGSILGDGYSDAAGSAANAALNGVFNLLGVSGPEILVHIALILGGAILMLWGVLKVAGIDPPSIGVPA